MYLFTFFRDYYNERGQAAKVNFYHPNKNHHSLKFSNYDYLMVFDLNKPVGAGGFKLVREEGKK